MRHVSPAFAEDPVRILRVARFAARFADFTVAPETLALMREMVAAGEVDALVPERVWQELARGLMEDKPSRMFAVLRDCGALARLLPEVDALWGVPQRADYHPEIDTGVHVMMVIDMAARLGAALPARFAALTHDLGKAKTPADILPRHHGHEGKSVALVEALCERLRVPVECRDVARLAARFHGDMHRVEELRADTRLSDTRTLRRAAPPGALRTDPARLRGRPSRPPGLGRAALRGSDDVAGDAGRGARGRCRCHCPRAGGAGPGRCATPSRKRWRPRASRRSSACRRYNSQPIIPAISEKTTAEAKGKEYSRPRRRKRMSPGRRPSGIRRATRGCSRPTTNTAANRTISHFSIRGAR
jgi:hypothetical protein